jgi:hypothetical protein
VQAGNAGYFFDKGATLCNVPASKEGAKFFASTLWFERRAK